MTACCLKSVAYCLKQKQKKLGCLHFSAKRSVSSKSGVSWIAKQLELVGSLGLNFHALHTHYISTSRDSVVFSGVVFTL